MLFKHKKTGGVYRLQMVVTNESDLAPHVVYADVLTGMLWARPAAEFFDGRFEVYVEPKGVAATGSDMRYVQ